MQLAPAIDAWLEIHGTDLSASTQRDIERIASSVRETGWDDIACEHVDRQVQEDIINEATANTTLRGSVITEFLRVVISWAASDAPVEDELVDEEPVEAELAEAKPLEVDLDDEDLDDEDLDDGEAADLDEPEAALDDAVEAEQELDDLDLDLGDDAPMQDDAADSADEAAQDDAADADATGSGAASSFLSAIGASTTSVEEELAVPLEAELPPLTPKVGVFTQAAEEVPAQAHTGTDWITVAYFTVAAICFALVIYFYLSS